MDVHLLGVRMVPSLIPDQNLPCKKILTFGHHLQAADGESSAACSRLQVSLRAAYEHQLLHLSVNLKLDASRALGVHWLFWKHIQPRSRRSSSGPCPVLTVAARWLCAALAVLVLWRWLGCAGSVS